MPYPPPVPPATRTNATPDVDNHPSDHNMLSQALTEILNHTATVEQTIDDRSLGIIGGTGGANNGSYKAITAPVIGVAPGNAFPGVAIQWSQTLPSRMYLVQFTGAFVSNDADQHVLTLSLRHFTTNTDLAATNMFVGPVWPLNVPISFLLPVVAAGVDVGMYLYFGGISGVPTTCTLNASPTAPAMLVATDIGSTA
jgi:hypothetical protein